MKAEINGLEWQDIDFGRMEIRVNGTMIKVEGKDDYKGSVKTGESKRTIPMLSEIAKRLRKHRIEQTKLFLKFRRASCQTLWDMI